jgi:hypothetical protein
LHKDPSRWALLDEGAAFFKALMECSIPRKCIENPIQHKYARERIGRKQSQVIQPWMFGHMEQKATCLWLEGLPLLQPTNNVKDEMMQLPKREREVALPSPVCRQVETPKHYLSRYCRCNGHSMGDAKC